MTLQENEEPQHVEAVAVPPEPVEEAPPAKSVTIGALCKALEVEFRPGLTGMRSNGTGTSRIG